MLNQTKNRRQGLTSANDAGHTAKTRVPDVTNSATFANGNPSARGFTQQTREQAGKTWTTKLRNQTRQSSFPSHGDYGQNLDKPLPASWKNKAAIRLMQGLGSPHWQRAGNEEEGMGTCECRFIGPSEFLPSCLNITSQIVKPRVQTKHGEAAFSCYAAQHWNKLPAELKSAPTVSIFKSKLKTLLFSCAYD
ncbi:hypothetical protein N1851_032740 [Merluccius polli]|uniref:Uncharacterized protein n=1 Tax=Merluccius polli TaxID=89951 RepID=A0AA47M2G3_MERPO|nr:hypothetical protein N1851_032740 [Merluccius polli]